MNLRKSWARIVGVALMLSGALALPVACGVGEPGDPKEDDSSSNAGSSSTGGRPNEPNPSFGGDGGQDGETVTPDECDEEAADDPDAEFLDENCDGIDGNKARAIFVSPLGNDESAGSMDQPLATIEKGIEKALEASKDLYVCSDVYEENIVIRTNAVPLRIYGGYACLDGWSRTTAPVEVAPATGHALEVTDSEQALSFTRFRFVSKDAVELSGSSIAVRVVRATDVVFDRSEFIAGNGAPGANGAAARTHRAAADEGLAGVNAPLGSASTTLVVAHRTVPARTCDTDDGLTVTVRAGRGGSGGNGFASPVIQATSGALPPSDQRYTGAAGAFGPPGAVGFGALDADGRYLPSNSGQDGRFGQPGNTSGLRGGAGGGPRHAQGDIEFARIGGSGGSSGYPGCGGYPGMGGKAGGASIAVLIVDSEVRFERGSVQTGLGGAGGIPSDGGVGQAGGPGGVGGWGSYNQLTNRAATGANGTPGGKGGPGGAGAGGPSIGIAWSGAEPSLTGVTYKTGTGGPGGVGPAFSPRNGANGVTQDVYEYVAM